MALVRCACEWRWVQIDPDKERVLTRTRPNEACECDHGEDET